MLVIKLILAVGIVGITAYIGNLKAGKLKQREYILREMVTFLNLVKNEIKYMMSILPNAYESSRQKLVTPLKESIGQIVNDMISFENMDVIDRSIVENISKLHSLTDYDKNVISSTLKNLGRNDLESQINIIENGITILDNQIKEANDVKITNSKLYRTIGTITGIMIVVIFI
ncbi:MAG: stage III sporulation protein AB [Clostridia bacterium]|nr:stage III sporulation protein AB [Clostridia bacterium]